MSYEKDESREGYIRLFIVIAIFACLIFMVFTAYTNVRIKSDDGFGRIYYTDFSNKATGDSYFFDTTTQYLLQNFTINEKDNLDYDFCFGYNISTTTGIKINVIDDSANVLGTMYLINNTRYECTEIQFDDVRINNFIGIKCTNCDENNNFYLQKEFSGDYAKVVYFNSTDTIISEETTHNYLIAAHKDYKNVFRLFLFWFIMFLIVIALGVMFMGGFAMVANYIKDEFDKGLPGEK